MLKTGFQSAECDYLFLLGFTFRYMVLSLFALPLLVMSIIYARIFIIISRHQKDRQLNHERSTLTRGVIDTVGSIGTAAVVNLPELMPKAGAVKCTACAAQALRDDDDPTVSILSADTSEEATDRRRGLTDDAMNFDQDDIVAIDGESEVNCVDVNSLRWKQNEQDINTGQDHYGQIKSSVSNWSQSSSISPSSFLMEPQSSTVRKPTEKDPSESLCFTSSISSKNNNHLVNEPNKYRAHGHHEYCSPKEQVDQSSADKSRAYNYNCDEEHNKNQSVMDDNIGKVVRDDVTESIPRSTIEQLARGTSINLMKPQGNGIQRYSEGGVDTLRHIPQFKSNDKSNHEQDEEEIAQENNIRKLRHTLEGKAETAGFESREGGSDMSVTKTVSLAGLKAERSDSSKSNKNENKVPLKAQFSLGAGGVNDACSNRKKQLLTLPSQNRCLISKQQARCRQSHKGEKHPFFDRQPEENQQHQQRNTSVRLLQHSSPVRSSVTRDCTCDNKSRQVNAKLSRSYTIADHSNSASLNYRSATKTMVTMSGSQRSSISSAFTPSSIKSRLRRSPTVGSHGATIQPDCRSGNNTGHNNNNSIGTNTNVTGGSSIYEPQRRHIHASAEPQTNTKALITTLLILGTYFISYVPAIIYQVLTCVDNCPYPLYTIPFSRRVLLGAMTTLLLIAKSIIDPFIYSYRINAIQVAINRYLSKRKSKSSRATSMQASQRLTTASCLNNNNFTNLQLLPSNQNQYGHNLPHLNEIHTSNTNQQNSSLKILNNDDSDRNKSTIPLSTVLKLSIQSKKKQSTPFQNLDSNNTSTSKRPLNAANPEKNFSTTCYDVSSLPANVALDTQETHDENITSGGGQAPGNERIEKEIRERVKKEAKASKSSMSIDSRQGRPLLGQSPVDFIDPPSSQQVDFVDEQTSLISSVPVCNGLKLFTKNDSHSGASTLEARMKQSNSMDMICDDI